MAGSPEDPDDPNAPPADAPEPRADEPRAREVVTSKSTADLDDRLDPATVAQLAAWFGLPSFEELQEKDARALQELDEDPHAEFRKLQARIAADANPHILDHADGLRTAGDAMLYRMPGITLRIRTDLLYFDETFASHIGTGGEPREVRLPRWLDDDLAECAPQAILRDLHRPETEFSRRREPPEHEATLDERVAEIREIALASYKVRPQELAFSVAATVLDEMRALRRSNWTELPIPKREPES